VQDAAAGSLPRVLGADDDPLLVRYMSVAGAAAYSRKYERTAMRRFSNRRELVLAGRALDVLGPCEEVLDVPCGAGRLTPLLLDRATRVACVDVSPAMLAHARVALAEPIAEGRVTLVRGTVGALPFADGAFDAAVCWRLLHHLTERAVRVRALSELRRVSRRGVVISFADASTLKASFRAWRRRTRRSVAVSPRDLAGEARDAGLRLQHHRRLASPFSHLASAVLLPSS
jgi:ubiquinone/menaquinone biosynthesis C-methylase UbiE